MDFWVFVIVIVAMSIVAGIINTAINAKAKYRHNSDDLDLMSKRLEKTLDERLTKIEGRLGNMETLVLDQEKARKFDAL